MHKTNLYFLIISSTLLIGCNQKKGYKENKGSVFGTYYSIIYESEENYEPQFDSIFNAVSDYQSNSEISQLNQNGELKNPSKVILDQLKSASYFTELTNGAFEPTIKPLIEAWGFGIQERKKTTKKQVDSILNFVSFQNYIEYNDTIVKVKKRGVTLSLTALGEGYTLNRISEFLTSKGVQNFKAEIGGEMKCKGTNNDDKIWKIGIQNPFYVKDKSQSQVLGIVDLHNTSLSTSGSYRKYYVDSLGNKRPHLIDPKTGYPVKHNLLSASIKCEDAEKADALATACMVLGTDKAKALISSQEDIEGYLIFENQKDSLQTWSSSKFFEEK